MVTLSTVLDPTGEALRKYIWHLVHGIGYDGSHLVWILFLLLVISVIVLDTVGELDSYCDSANIVIHKSVIRSWTLIVELFKFSFYT